MTYLISALELQRFDLSIKKKKMRRYRRGSRPLTFDRSSKILFEDAKRRHVKLFDSDGFQSWISGTEGILWCPGVPGAGKTVTSSIIFDHLRKDAQQKSVAIACLFCNSRDRVDQSAETFMANLLKQIIQDYANLSENVKCLYQEHRSKRPTFAQTADVFRTEIKRFSAVFVVIDALDETTENDDIRTLLLSELESLPIHLLVTLRYDTIIERRVEDVQCLEIRATDGDVHTYVKARIASEKTLLRHIERNPWLEETIIRTVVDKSRKM